MTTLATSPSWQSIIILTVFTSVYITFILKKLLAAKIDLYDFIMLSTVSLLPSAFIFFPKLGYMLAVLTGISVPYILLFSALFFILFVICHQLIVTCHKLERENRLLIQEISLLKKHIGFQSN